MNALSTRGGAATSLADAIALGLAGDGGLFVPERFPRLVVDDFDGQEQLADIAATLLQPLFADSTLAPALAAMCAEALSFPTPLRRLDEDTHLLELFHGPTAAFKDIGARFLAACLARLYAVDRVERTILVATSGDTGGAVADAFFQRPGFGVVILYPAGRVSPRQAHLLGCYGGNVRTFEVAGSFDDCQALVKRAFGDRELQQQRTVTSANSISLGRLLPQMSYYAQSSLRFFREHGARLDYVIPTGNLGNALACLYARRIGLPIGEVVLATNANRVLPEFFAGADYAPRASVATLANAMDVGAPSNFERLRHLFPGDALLRAKVSAQSVTDAELLATIERWHARHGAALCPHTAAAACVRDRLREADAARPWCVVATAHPAKFEGVVEPCIGRALEPPRAMVALLARPAHAAPMPARYEALRAQLLA